MKNFFIYLVFTLITAFAWAHGENKPGPHEGFIRMPGAFHTELVPVGKDQVKIYLLDMDWKNPTVKNSTVTLEYLASQKVQGACEPKENQYFLCSFPSTISIDKHGKFIVNSSRDGQKGMAVDYELPLKGSHH